MLCSFRKDSTNTLSYAEEWTSFLIGDTDLCFLRDERLAKIVEDALLHFAGQRYALHAWCVMPNHFHMLFTPNEGY